jgi:hypothetical protein
LALDKPTLCVSNLLIRCRCPCLAVTDLGASRHLEAEEGAYRMFLAMTTYEADPTQREEMQQITEDRVFAALRDAQGFLDGYSCRSADDPESRGLRCSVGERTGSDRLAVHRQVPGGGELDG